MELNIQGVVNEMLKTRLHKLCAFKPRYYDFPGSLPVSLNRSDISYLRRNYIVCDKTDGTRYFLFSTMNQVYLVDRLLRFFHLGESLQYTEFVYDGELVVNNTDSNKWHFMIFDVFATNNKVVKDIPDHSKRIALIQNLDSIHVHNLDSTHIHNLDVRIKRFFFTPDFRLCARRIDNGISYKTDGYIFTPLYRKIFNGTDKRTYKWKDGCDHTIDFELLDDGKIYLWDKNNTKIVICELEYENNVTANDIIKPCIVECKIRINSDKTSWIFIKNREDKDRPNSMRTYLSTIQVINEDITEDELNFNLSINK